MELSDRLLKGTEAETSTQWLQEETIQGRDNEEIEALRCVRGHKN